MKEIQTIPCGGRVDMTRLKKNYLCIFLLFFEKKNKKIENLRIPGFKSVFAVINPYTFYGDPDLD